MVVSLRVNPSDMREKILGSLVEFHWEPEVLYRFQGNGVTINSLAPSIGTLILLSEVRSRCMLFLRPSSNLY